MRSLRVSSSGSSLLVTITPRPSRQSSRITRYNSALAPTSTPRVGSSSSSTLGFVSNQRPTIHFCWFPPLSDPIGGVRPAVLIPRLLTIEPLSCRSFDRLSIGPMRASLSEHVEMFRPTFMVLKIPKRLRSSVTSARPALSASAGCLGWINSPSRRISPVGSKAVAPKRHSSSSVRPAPIKPAIPSTSPR